MGLDAEDLEFVRIWAVRLVASLLGFFLLVGAAGLAIRLFELARG